MSSATGMKPPGAPTTDSGPRVSVRRVRVEGLSRRHSIAIACNAVALIAVAIALFLMKPDDRALAAPMLALAEIVLLFMSLLWARDGVPPVFESGALCVLAT